MSSKLLSKAEFNKEEQFEDCMSLYNKARYEITKLKRLVYLVSPSNVSESCAVKFIEALNNYAVFWMNQDVTDTPTARKIIKAVKLYNN